MATGDDLLIAFISNVWNDNQIENFPFDDRNYSSRKKFTEGYQYTFDS